MVLSRQGPENSNDSLLLAELEVRVEIDEQLKQCHSLIYANPDSAMALCRDALEISTRREYPEGCIRANLLLGILYDVSSKYDSALFHYRTSLDLSHEIGDTLRVASNNANIGLTFYNMGNFTEAMSYFLNSLEYFEQVGFSDGIASTYNNMGMIYTELTNHSKSLEYYKKALKIREERNDSYGMAAALTNIGNIYNKMDSLDKGIGYLERSIVIKDSINDVYGLTVSKTILGGIYIKKGLLDKAQKYLDRSIELSKEIESPGQEINAYLVYIGLLTEKGQYAESIRMSEKALKMAQDIGSLSFQASAFKQLSESYQLLGNTSKALEYYKLHIEKKEEVLSRDRINQVFQLELDNEREKKASEIALLNRQAEINALQIETQRLLLSRRNSIMVAIVIIFMGTLLLAYLYYTQQKSRQKLRLNDALAQVQKQVARGAIEAEIKERQRIGEELHDSFGQVLSLIKLNLTKVQKIKDISEEKREEMMEHTVALANKAFVDLRDISHNMSPIMLKTKGLVHSVKDLLDRIEETNQFVINFEAVDMEGNLEPIQEFTLFRTIQELLNNILNHAQATEITVQMLRDNGDITIMVEDDGKGFDFQQLDSVNGMGLKNTLSRIKNLNGEMIVDSAADRGTIITIIVPVELHL